MILIVYVYDIDIAINFIKNTIKILEKKKTIFRRVVGVVTARPFH